MTADQTTSTTTISSRARNLGVGWSTTPSGHGTGIVPPDKPDAVGGLRTIARELERLGRVTSGGVYHRVRLFVAGRPIVGWLWGAEWCDGERDLGFLLDELRRGEVITVRLGEDDEVPA